MIRTRYALILALTLFACSAFAQDWRGLLKSADHDLRDGNYYRARRTTIKLINSMNDNLGTGDGAMYTVGLTVAYRAIAEAGLQNYDDADWYWHVARDVYPAFAKQFDFSSYGEAGAWLEKAKSENAAIEPDSSPGEASAGEPRQDPVCLNRRDPRYPVGAVLSKVSEPITIRVLIDGDGAVRHPVLVSQATAPTLVWAATEAVKQWRFQPAMVGGKAAPIQFDLTVNFETPAAEK